MSLDLHFSRAGGLSNTPVQYTNSRSFKNMYKGTGLLNTPVQYTKPLSYKNMYKGTGSLSSSELLQGLDTGQGLSKGHTILNTGGGLIGTSLFKMKHYNPLETIDDDVGGEEEKHSGGETKKTSTVPTAITDVRRLITQSPEGMADQLQLQARADEENVKAHQKATAIALEIAKTGTKEEILKAVSEVRRLFELTPGERVKQLQTNGIL